jgi:hypothetical protein
MWSDVGFRSVAVLFLMGIPGMVIEYKDAGRPPGKGRFGE